jgi:hypothetical protein
MTGTPSTAVRLVDGTLATYPNVSVKVTTETCDPSYRQTDLDDFEGKSVRAIGEVTASAVLQIRALGREALGDIELDLKSLFDEAAEAARAQHGVLPLSATILGQVVDVEVELLAQPRTVPVEQQVMDEQLWVLSMPAVIRYPDLVVRTVTDGVMNIIVDYTDDTFVDFPIVDGFEVEDFQPL